MQPVIPLAGQPQKQHRFRPGLWKNTSPQPVQCSKAMLKELFDGNCLYFCFDAVCFSKMAGDDKDRETV